MPNFETKMDSLRPMPACYVNLFGVLFIYFRDKVTSLAWPDV